MKLEINKENLDQELAQQSSNFVYAATKAAINEEAYYQAKKELEEITASVGLEIRNKATEDKEKVTEKLLSDRVIMDQRVSKAIDYVNETRKHMSTAKGVRDAWNMRKDLLLRIAHNASAEMHAFGKDTVKTSMESLAKSA